MTAVLSRQTILGIAPEVTPGTIVTPTAYIPVMADLQPEYVIAPLRDESYRANDTVLQGQYGGPSEATFNFSTSLYPIESGHFFRAIIGPDTVTVAPASSTLSAPITAGTNAISITVAGTPGQVVLVADGVNPPEIRYLVTASTVNQNWQFAHNTAAPVTYLTRHVFTQPSFPQPQPKTYSLTDYDAVQTLAYAYARLASLNTTVDSKGIVGLKGQFKAFPPVTASTPTPTYTTLQPLLGWQGSAYPSSLAAAGQITRYNNVDFTLSREIDVQHTLDGTQGPREIDAAGIELKAKVGAIYENVTDFTNFTGYVQAGLQTFVGSTSGTGAALLVNLGQASTNKLTVHRAQKFAMADFDIDAVYNATNSGLVTVSLWNTQSTAY